jgi:hypothetical protein
MHEHDDLEADRLDADRIEADWKRALDIAGDAVSAGSRSNALEPADASAELEHIDAERKWLHRFRPTLRRMLPRRR